MSVENLRNSRNNPVAIFTQFTRLYKEYELALYCFFEGEDSKYFGIRIKNIARPKKDIYLSCGGKEGVLGIYRMLSARKEYENIAAAYFIDKDFDVSIRERGLSEIYETPCYSIENFYTSSECFSNILKSEFKLTEIDEDFGRCISLYTGLQEEFHDAVELLNAWIACQRQNSSKLNISNLSILKFVNIGLDKITVRYTIEDIHTRFENLPIISHEKLDAKKAELLASNRQKSFRGKFEIEFLFIVLQKLIEESNKDSSPYFTKKLAVKFSLQKNNIISTLSQYADTPACLYKYLKSFDLNQAI
jgi:hypothetical protein